MNQSSPELPTALITTFKKWWKIMEEFQVPISWEGPPPSEGGDGGAGSWWEPLEELFHNGHEPASFTKK